jgi:hypothetical protein
LVRFALRAASAPLARRHEATEGGQMAGNQQYIKVKIDAVETEIKNTNKRLKELKERLAGYKAQLEPEAEAPAE